jgi:hypothetical protein
MCQGKENGVLNDPSNRGLSVRNHVFSDNFFSGVVSENGHILSCDVLHKLVCIDLCTPL